MSNHDDIITQFKDITGTSEENATFFLESSNWALEDAISSFYESQGENAGGTAAGSSVLVADSPSNNEKKVSGEPSAVFNRTVKPKIATLNTMSRDDSDEEEGQAFYAGGSERSGQQVLGSPKRKNFRDQLTNMFKMAQETASAADVPSTSGERNWGVGARLGQSADTESERIEVKTNDSQTNIETVVLKLWRQGFSINDGGLRAYDNPINKMFLETVMRGEIPEEMRRMGSQVGVDVEDHRHEDFKSVETKVRTFNGAGHMLGSVTPAVSEDSPSNPVCNPSTNQNEQNEERASQNLNINATAQTTTVQIRLADGTRFAAQFNVTHTINDIREYIITSRPEYEHRSFILVTSFPTKELTDGSSTIEDAKLHNAVLMQRLK